MNYLNAFTFSRAATAEKESADILFVMDNKIKSQSDEIHLRFTERYYGSEIRPILIV